MEYLVIIHIGPVQDFIASARRSRDLWFGSWLLSELSKVAAYVIAEKEGIESLIFPAPEELPDLAPNSSFDVANKIVAIIKSNPKEICEQALTNVKARLNEIKEDAFKKLYKYFDGETANAQIADMLETFWVATKLGEYDETRKRAEALMAARKSTKNYKKILWGKAGIPKSSFDGQREAVIDPGKFPEEELLRNCRIKPSEYLCGVSLLKRHGERGKGNDRFFSTSHVAALPFLELLKEENKAAVRKYILTLKQDLGLESELGNVPGDAHPAFENYDGHILFKERLEDLFAVKDKNLDKAKEALQNFYKNCQLENKRPSPYYGLLLGDGDRMGEAIDTQNTRDKHRNISQALSRFASNVRNIVPKHKGSLVYAGGDDVLAFVPIHTILDCAFELNQDFKQKLKAFRVPKKSPNDNDSPTLSVGIAIVHHLDPLSDSLELVRKAEKAAKSVAGKNALAVTVSKRSGVDLTIKGSWGQIDERLKTWITLHANNQIPDGLAYELRDLTITLGDVPKDLMQAEAKRIFRRKKVDEKFLANIEQTIDKGEVSVKDLADELVVARIFAEAEKLISKGKGD
ncbi:MAG: type III-B CRISPR-associated protein Cas10/Cmr2 [Blastocatellia bacterium]